MARQCDWTQFGDCKIDTGYDPEILDYVAEQYGHLFSSLKSLYDLYSFIHLYPTRRRFAGTLKFSKDYFYGHLIHEMDRFACVLNEIHWSDRLNQWNHCQHFPYFVTGMLSFPLSK